MKKNKLEKADLSIIDNIRFTSREIDVISAILNNRGEKKIASILSISHRTVSSHVHNIMLKTSQNSKDGIIDFIENRGKSAKFNLHYQELLSEKNFKQYLLKIKDKIIKKEITFEVSSHNSKHLKEYEKDLKAAGIAIIFSQDKSLPSFSDILENCPNSNYYDRVIFLIEKISKNQNISQIIGTFQRPDHTEEIEPSPPIDNFLQKKRNVIIATILLLLLLIPFLYKEIFIKSKTIARSNMPLPHHSTLLHRHKILNKIDRILSKKNGISIAILLGEEGVGKSILARSYAKSQDRPIIWEIDASSQENLLLSFERLSYFLMESKEDRDEMEYIEKVSVPEAKIKKLEHFIQKKSRSHKNWLIIYNNVHSFDSISQYFPHDNKVWGNGSVIILTRNSAIRDHPFISEENIIQINPLSREEKRLLFTQIMPIKSNLIDSSFEKLLDRIPPYPFDILHVANYIKKEKISCSEYLSFLKSEEDQSNNQSLSIERNQIISKSVQHILSQDNNFIVPFILISTLNHKNIPQKLIEFTDKNLSSSKFIATIQRLAFIDHINPKLQSFSINKSLQKSILDNIKTIPLFKENTQKAAEILNDYFAIKLNQNNIDEVREIIPHIESFVKNLDEDEYISKAELYLKLGNSFFDLGAYNKAKKYFDKSEKIYLKYYTNLHPKIINLHIRMGVLNRNMSNYAAAKTYLQNALSSSKKVYSHDSQEVARTYIYLGSVYRNLEEFSKAYEYTIQGTKILKASPNPSKKEIIKAEAYLGCIYTNLGKYEAAQKILEKSLAQYKELYKDTHTKTSWVKTRLAIVYSKKGLLEESKKLLIEARENYLELSGDSSFEYAWTSSHLGATLNKLGEIAEGNAALKESISLYKKYYPNNHQSISWAESNIAKTK